jgi:hypothetical protein
MAICECGFSVATCISRFDSRQLLVEAEPRMQDIL